jgi:REP element-mobilizing transposase RayT
MKSGFYIKNQDLPHFVTMTVTDWADIFSRKIYRDILIDSLKYCCREKGMILYAYVIMTNHIHLVIQSEKGKLSDLIRDFKKFTSAMIIRQLPSKKESRRDWLFKRFEFANFRRNNGANYQLWRSGNHPIEVSYPKILWQKINYIHLNPVKAGIVNVAWHYVYSSASNYAGKESILEVTLADNPIIHPKDYFYQNFNPHLF